MSQLNCRIFICGFVIAAVIVVFKSAEAAILFLTGVPLGMASVTAYSDITGALLRTGGRVFLPFILLGVKFSVLIYLVYVAGPNYNLSLWLILGAFTFIPAVLLGIRPSE